MLFNKNCNNFRTSTNVYLLNLAIADIITLVFGLLDNHYDDHYFQVKDADDDVNRVNCVDIVVIRL